MTAQTGGEEADVEKIVDALAGALWDLVILAGGMAIAWGAGLIYPPAGIITAGVLAVAAGVLGGIRALAGRLRRGTP